MFSPRLIARLHGAIYNWTLNGSVPAATGAAPGTLSLSKKIDGSYHFLSGLMQIVYSTLSAAATDSGTNTLSAQFRSDVSSVMLSDDFIDLACVAAPGRQRTVAVAGDPSQQLHITGLPWFYPYRAGSEIAIDLRNTSAEANTVFFNYMGVQVPTAMFPNIEDVLRVIAEYDPAYGIPSVPSMLPPGYSAAPGQNPGFPRQF